MHAQRQTNIRNFSTFKRAGRPAEPQRGMNHEEEQRPRPCTLVMGLAIGYPLRVYQIFLESLRHNSYAGDVTLVIGNDAPPSTFAICSTHGARAVRATAVGLDRRASTQSSKHPQILRYQVYANLCRAGEHDYCFATDFRDVVFQRDPFERSGLHAVVRRPDLPQLVLSLEHSNMTIGTEAVNAYWLRVCKGKLHLSMVAHRPIICSGTVYGNPSGFAALAKAFNETRCMGYRDGIDQAMLNWLVHYRSPTSSPSATAAVPTSTGGSTPLSSRRSDEAIEAASEAARFSRLVGVSHAIAGAKGSDVLAGVNALAGVKLTLQPRGAGAVNSLWGFTRDLPAASSMQELLQHRWSNGLVLNDDGRPSPVIHQYDRLVQPLWQVAGQSFEALSRYDAAPCLVRQFRPKKVVLKAFCYRNGTQACAAENPSLRTGERSSEACPKLA